MSQYGKFYTHNANFEKVIMSVRAEPMPVLVMVYAQCVEDSVRPAQCRAQ